MACLLVPMLQSECFAATHYVVTNGTPGWIGATDPYTNWATAGTNIIDVVNTAMTNPASRVVWVTNGTYNLTNVIAITNAMTIQSVKGRNATILAGQGSIATNRCLSFSATGSVFDGFTVTNFAGSSGGAVYGATGGISIINCLFVGNSNASGGGLYIYTTGSGVIVTNCVFSNNIANYNGGGLALSHGSGINNARVEGCYFYGNLCNPLYGGAGGGCYISGYNCVVSNCIAINNTHTISGGGFGFLGGNNNTIVNCSAISNTVTSGAYSGYGGGGIVMNSAGLIKDCLIISNKSGTSAISGGGGVRAGPGGIVKNCLIARNQANGGAGGGVYLTNGAIESCTISCTIVSNYAAVSGGGLYIAGPGSGTNNIIYFNTAPDAANFTNTAGNTGLQYSCVIPAVDGARNITNDPSLVNLNGGDYHLNGNSPCVNAGLNQSWMTNAVDRDGRSRIRYGTVDMGAYERINSGVIYTVH